MFTNFLKMWRDFKKLRKAKNSLDTKGFVPLADLSVDQRYRRAYDKAKDDIANWPHC
jgi:hypothetical protein